MNIPPLASLLSDYPRRVAEYDTPTFHLKDFHEAHHTHVIASLLEERGRKAYVEAYYGEGSHRADVWLRESEAGHPAAFVEVKCVWLDGEGAFYGGKPPSFHLAHWRHDLERLSRVGADGPAHCAFLLLVYGGVADPVDVPIENGELGLPDAVRWREVWRDLDGLVRRVDSLSARDTVTRFATTLATGGRFRVAKFGHPNVVGEHWFAPIAVEWLTSTAP